MHYRPLGRTGLTVSALSLGTVSLGVDYGIAAPGEFGRPSEADALRLLRAAVDRGITLVDTAPAYGDAERLIGQAIAENSGVIVATKVSPPLENVNSSLDASRRALNRNPLDIVQIHNATAEMIAEGRETDLLADAQRRGVVRFLGATVYGEEAAMAAIRAGRFDVLQVAFNALDQRMAREVLPAAHAAGVGVIVRSAFLKGALTPKAQWLPESLAAVREAAGHARDLLAGGDWEQLPAAAMRFCLSAVGVASVLTGARTLVELDAALAAEAAGPFDAAVLDRAAALGITDERLLNPSYWPVP